MKARRQNNTRPLLQAKEIENLPQFETLKKTAFIIARVEKGLKDNIEELRRKMHFEDESTTLRYILREYFKK